LGEAVGLGQTIRNRELECFILLKELP
jgi:hypothetical protein